jgi:hypothetical protein
MTRTDPRNRPTSIEGLRRRVIRELRDHEMLSKAVAMDFLRQVARTHIGVGPVVDSTGTPD